MHRMLEWLIEAVDDQLLFISYDKRPQWWNELRGTAFVSEHQRHKAARRGNPTLMQHWVDADTPHADLLEWFDHCISLAPYREQLESFHDQVAVFIIDAPAEEHQRRSSGYTFATPEDDVVFHWQGDRISWRLNGQAALKAAIPLHHLGLTLAVNTTPFVPILEHEGVTIGVQ